MSHPMKLTHLDENTQLLETNNDVWTTIRHIAATIKQKESFYVVNVQDIIDKYLAWSTAMPRITPFYAVKCNHNATILKILATLGYSFDCSSKSEIETVLSLGVKPDRIIFAHTTKLPSHIAYAASVNVTYSTFDCESELLKLKKFHPDIQLLVRIRYDSPSADIPLGCKFGCDPFKEAPKLLQIARSLDLKVVGVAFHIGHLCQDPSSFRDAIVVSRRVFNFADSLGYKFNLLDIGGGFPGYRGSIINKFAEVINSALEEYFPDPSVRVIAEPGTYVTSSAFTLTCNVFALKSSNYVDSVTKKATPKYLYYIDDGVFGSFCMTLHGGTFTPLPLKQCSGDKLCRSTVWGPTCDPLDKVADNVLLPKLDLGDWLVFENMGDYSTSFSTAFNGFFTPKIYIIANEDTWLYLENKNFRRVKKSNL